MVRDYGRAARIARLPVSMEAGSLTDSDAIDRAIDGCETVFHCAYDWRNPEHNLIGISNLISACQKSEVRRIIHVSTSAVYEPLPDGVLTETSKSEYSGLPYADEKLTIERQLLGAAGNAGLPAVVLQPTIVYGPFANSWTTDLVKQLLTGTVVLPDDGTGLCNPVYVDDVCDAMLLASERDDVVGERFLISGPDHVTWRAFFGGYEEALGVNSVWSLPREEIARLHNSKSTVGLGERSIGFARRHLSKAAKARLRKLRRLGGQRGGRGQPDHRLYMPDPQELALFSAKCRVDISKAQRMLGYDPRFNFESGMSLTSRYLSWAYTPAPSLQDGRLTKP